MKEWPVGHSASGWPLLFKQVFLPLGLEVPVSQIVSGYINPGLSIPDFAIG